MQVQISKWGNSLALRLPKEIASRLGLIDGTRVEVTTEADRIVISAGRPVYTLAELTEGLTPEALHEAFDWGDDRGREAIDE